MKEQSHKDEMSAAIRGDFQRLRDRGVPATLVPHEASVSAAETTADEPPGPREEPFVLARGEHPPSARTDEPPGGAARDAGDETEPPSDGALVADPAEEPAPARSGWLARLVGR